MSDFSFSPHLHSVNELLHFCRVSLPVRSEVKSYELELPENIASKFNSNDEMYIINLDAKHLREYVPKYFQSREDIPLSRLIRSFYDEVINHYCPTSTFYEMLFFNNNNLILLGKLRTSTFENNSIYTSERGYFNTLGGAFYQVIPSQGVFISILHVLEKYRRQYIGKLILTVLQQISKTILNTQRLLVWVTRLPIQQKQKKKKYVDQNSHITFYRKLGFFPSNPLNLPLHQMVTSELASMMKEPMSTFGTETVENDSVEFVVELYQRIAWEPKKTTKHLLQLFHIRFRFIDSMPRGQLWVEYVHTMLFTIFDKNCHG